MKQKITDGLKEFLDDESLTERVYNKSIEVINTIDDKYFNIDLGYYPSKWKTLIIDFIKDSNELSLEIGYKSLGYFTETEEGILKQVDFLPISSIEDLTISIKTVEKDLDNLL